MGALLFLSFPPEAPAVDPARLTEEEMALLAEAMRRLDPLVDARKRGGMAPLLTFEELYAPLDSAQRAFLAEVRRMDPTALNGASRRFPEPPSAVEFVRLGRQTVLRDGKPVLLDAQFLPRPVTEAYRRMMAAMEADLGKRLLVESGYRSPGYQLYLFLYYLPKHGHSIRETNRHVALPGCSEHGSPARQAIDFVTPGGINGEDRPEEFEELQEYGWLRARAHEFGFHLSYPRGGPSAFEPWHWRWENLQE